MGEFLSSPGLAFEYVKGGEQARVFCTCPTALVFKGFLVVCGILNESGVQSPCPSVKDARRSPRESLLRITTTWWMDFLAESAGAQLAVSLFGGHLRRGALMIETDCTFELTGCLKGVPVLRVASDHETAAGC